MVTKLKKSKLYSIQAKTMAMIFIFIFSVTGYLGVVTFMKLNIDYDSSPMQYDDYFETSNFITTFNDLMYSAVKLNLVYKSEEDIKNGKAISNDDYIRELAEENGVDLSKFDFNFNDFNMSNVTYDYDLFPSDESKFNSNQSVTKNNLVAVIKEVVAEEVTANATEAITEDEEYNYKMFIKLLNEQYPTYKRNLIQEQLYEYKYHVENLQKSKNFRYYIADEKGNIVASNSTLDSVKRNKTLITFDGPYVSGMETPYYNINENVQDVIEELNYKLYASVNDKLNFGDSFYAEQENFNNSKGIAPIVLIDVLLSAALVILLSFYVMIVAGESERGGIIAYRSVDKIYTDIHTFIFTIFASLSFLLAYELLYQVAYNMTTNLEYIYYVAIGILMVIDIFIGLSYLCSMSRQIKGKCIFRNTLCSCFIRKIGSLFSGKTFKGWLVMLMFLYGAANVALMFFTIIFPPTIIVLIAFNIFALYLFFRALSSLTNIMNAAHETSIGNINYELDIKKISPSFINFATDVANIQRGLKNAVSEAVKGERMKIDLITNVSHDLKTPLTSIITYVDLLKKEGLENETAQKYVDILDEKSGRLKQLIEDLIEASKASSGNLSVTKEKVDLRQLVMQASGEFEEKIMNSGLNLIISSEGAIAVNADGKHMWRIVENLLSNTIKYSMPNSRVYIDILKTESKGVLIIKNMSAQPIEVTPDQLMERFVRGEESRTTEGSGLGLSIAQSLTTLQGGELKISIDGDLFKVCVIMPLFENIDVVDEKEDI